MTLDPSDVRRRLEAVAQREPVRVVGEIVDWTPHAPEVLQHMRDSVAELQRQGVVADD